MERTRLESLLTTIKRRQTEERLWGWKAIRPDDYNPHGVKCNDQYGFIHSPAVERWLFGGNRQLAYGTLVRMSNGKTKPIEKLKLGDSVLCWDGKQASPGKVIDIPFDDYSETWLMQTRSGLSVEADERHCFPAILSGDGTGNLRKHTPQKHTLGEIRDSKSRRRRLTKASHIEYDKTVVPFSGLLMGLYLGDGSYGGVRSANFTNRNSDILSLFKKEYAKSYSDKCQPYPSDTGRLYITPRMSAFRRNLDILGLQNKHAHQKFVPDCFKYGSRQVRRGLLGGIILTDGCVDRYKVAIYSTSLRMLEDIAEVILSLGGRSRIYQDHKPENEHQKTGYKVQFSIGYVPVMGLSLLHKQSRNNLMRKAREDDIIVDSIKYVGVKRCRCITVDHPRHAFVLANGIITYNSSKSESAVADAILFATGQHPVRSVNHPPPVRIRFCAPSYEDGIKAVVLRKFKQLVKLCDLKGGTWEKAWSEASKTLTFANGSPINFKSGEQHVDKYGGADLDACYQDEHLRIELYRENKMRLVDRAGYLVGSMTPELGSISWERRHILHQGEGRVARWFFSTYGNPYISVEGIEEIEKTITDPRLRDVKLYGKFVALAGLVYPQFHEAVHVIEDREIPRDWYRVFCIDPHIKKASAMIWAAWSPDNELIVYRCAKEVKTVSELKSFIRAKSAGERIQLWLGDEAMGGDGKNIFGEESVLSQLNSGPDALPIVGTNQRSDKAFEAGVYAVREMLLPDPVSKKPNLLVLRSCQGVVDEFDEYQFIPDSKADEMTFRERVRKVDDDYMDDIRYITQAGACGSTVKPVSALDKAEW